MAAVYIIAGMLGWDLSNRAGYTHKTSHGEKALPSSILINLSETTPHPEIPRKATRANAIKMLANSPKPQPRRKSAALEVMLSSLETAGDLLSGSECSSLASSPVHESVFTFRSSSFKQRRGRDEKSRLARSSLAPIDVVREFLKSTSEPHTAKALIAVDAKFECHSVVARGKNRDGEAPRAAQGDIDDLLSSCSRCNIEIDGIFACGEDVAAFGHLVYSDGPSSLPQDVHFSIWACVDAAREQIVELRWLDQVGRAEGDLTDRQRYHGVC